MIESAASPTMVEPIVRDQRAFPLVHTFIFARVYELQNSPQKNAKSDAPAMRGTSPKIASMADWFSEWSIDAFIASVALYLVFVAALFS